MKFIVEAPEVHYQRYMVEADSPIEALREMLNGEGEIVEGSLRYSYVHENGCFTVIDEAGSVHLSASLLELGAY